MTTDQHILRTAYSLLGDGNGEDWEHNVEYTSAITQMVGELTGMSTADDDGAAILARIRKAGQSPSLLPMLNGSRVIFADVSFDDRGVGTGVVVAEHDAQFAVWRVWLHKGETGWLAESGHYSRTLDSALTNYNERRGMVTDRILHTVSISTRFGPIGYIETSHEAAKDRVADFVEQWWDEEMRFADQKPTDRDEKIDAYFEFVQSESYEIAEATVTL